MQGDVGPESVARGDLHPPTQTRRSSSRLAKPSSKVSEVRGAFENTTTTTRRVTGLVARAASTEEELERPEEVRKSRGNGETGKSMLVRVLEELKELKDASCQQREFMQQWQRQQIEHEQQLHELIRDLQQEIANTKEELKQVKEQLEAGSALHQDRESPLPGGTQMSVSYADVVRNSGHHQRNGVTGPRQARSSPSTSELLFCTIETSQSQAREGVDLRPGETRALVERKLREEWDSPGWRCQAVTAGSRSPQLIRVVCRDKAEHGSVKRVLEANLPQGARVLRDEYYQIKVDGVSRSSILDEAGRNLPGVNETLGRENDAEIVKIGWLSDRLLKDHGSMVVYLKNAADGAREDSQAKCVHSNDNRNPDSAIIAKNSPTTKHTSAGNHRGAEDALKKVIITAYVPKRRRNAYRVADPMNRSANTAGGSTHPAMSKSLRIIQLNVRKRGEVHDSLMDDEELQDAAVIAIQEPQARKIKGRLLVTPMAHHKWTKMVPSVCKEDGRWAIRSMLWIRKDLEADQVPIESSDLMAAVLKLLGRLVLVVSVYVEGVEKQALTETCRLLREVIVKARSNAGQDVEVLITGDFNRHDQLWGGDEILPARQGEADEIIELMTECSLSSLLPRGTKTWKGGDHETTVGLVLASEGLADDLVKCRTHDTEHGSDHRTIETVFETEVYEQKPQERLLFKNAPWKEINIRIAASLERVPTEGTVQQNTDRLMAAVLEAVRSLTPKAKPSPYTKRWWTSDLTQLRHIYTYWRNRSRANRRAGCRATELEETAKAAAKQYHDAIRQRNDYGFKAEIPATHRTSSIERSRSSYGVKEIRHVSCLQRQSPRK